MPLRLTLAVREGWKQKDNERFGDCLEVRYIDTSNDKILFRYAPTLSDQKFWEETFTKLRKYDDLHKEIYTLVAGSIEGESHLSMGSMEKCKD